MQSAYANNKSVADIARDEDISRQRAHQILKRVGFPRRELPANELMPQMVAGGTIPVDVFVEVYQFSASAEEAAQRLDIGVAGMHIIAGKLRRQGYDLRKWPQQGPKTKLFAEVFNSSASLAEAAERLGRTVDSVKVYASMLRSRGVSLALNRPPKKTKPLPKLRSAYLAGLIDASGYFNLRIREQGGSKFVACKLAITSPGAEVAQRLVADYDGRIRRADTATYVEWHSRQKIKVVLEACQKYVLARREHINIMLCFIESGDIVEVENLQKLYHKEY